MKKSCIMFLLALVCTATVRIPAANAIQPYNYNGGLYLINAYQEQGSYICGQTCIYIVSRYFGDVGPEGEPHYYKIKKGLYWYTYNMLSYYMATTYWVYYVYSGISVSIGLDMIESLKDLNKVQYYNERNDSAYSTGLRTFDSTTTASPDSKEDRLDYIRDQFLEMNIPVIIHLDRDDTAGHYIILAGYENGTVYYVNPNDDNCPGGYEGNALDVIHEVPVDAFLEDYWYVCDADGAYWDGKWFAFYHQKPFTR